MITKRILITVTAIFLWLHGHAQHFSDLLPIKNIFGQEDSFPGATRAIVSGKEEKSLADKHLDYFQSISVTNRKSMEKINAEALRLSSLAADQESYISKGVINYAFYAFHPCKNVKRYFFIFSNGQKTVAMYMEGSATFSEIKRMIKK